MKSEPKYFKLNEDKIPIQCSLNTWAIDTNRKNYILARSLIGNSKVHIIFIGTSSTKKLFKVKVQGSCNKEKYFDTYRESELYYYEIVTDLEDGISKLINGPKAIPWIR